MRPKARLATAFLAILLVDPALRGCSFGGDEITFFFRTHPDDLKEFAAGRLGVVGREFARSYLYVAYRSFSGLEFGLPEREALVDFWHGRLGQWSARIYGTRPSGAQTWQKARAQIRQTADSNEYFQTTRLVPEWYFAYTNCSDDAFAAAARTLQEKVTSSGAASRPVLDWLGAQEIVFSNCAEGRVMPERLSADADPVERADREYQIAAALFYAADFEAAEKAFRAIAGDSRSRWSSLAPYLVARCLVRRATLIPGDEPFDPQLLGLAEAELLKILSDGSLRESHRPSRQLLNFVHFRNKPAERLQELSARLLQGGHLDTLEQDLWDYLLLLDRLVECGRLTPDPCRGKRIAYDRGKDDLTDWIATFSDHRPAATNYAVERWKATGSVPWLVAALAAVGPEDPSSPALLNGARAVSSSSSAFPTIEFHRARLLVGLRRDDEAMEVLRDVRKRGIYGLSRSTGNQFSQLESLLARSLGELLESGARVPAGMQEGFELPQPSGRSFFGTRYNYQGWPRFLSREIVEVLNHLTPLQTLERAASVEGSPEHVQQELLSVAWSRAALLRKRTAANRLSAELAEHVPRLRTDLEAFRSARGDRDRDYFVARLMLRQPMIEPVLSGEGLNFEVSSFNRPAGWCFEMENARTSGRRPDGFLNEAERAESEAEHQALRTLGAGANFFCRAAIAYARAHPNEDDAADTLYLAIQVTRRGCRDVKTSEWSKQAFRTLHKLFPDSPYAKKAKYWY